MLRLLFVLLFSVLFMRSFAQQNDYLDKPVSLKVSGLTLKETFKLLSSQTSVVFSYSNDFNDLSVVTYSCKAKPLRIVLDDLLRNTKCNYNLKGKYVIIKCNVLRNENKRYVSGYVYSVTDSTVLYNVSFYFPQLKYVANSNLNGYFKLNYPEAIESIDLHIAKERYNDTVIRINHLIKEPLQIYLQPQRSTIELLPTKELNVNNDSIRNIRPVDSTVLRDPVQSFLWSKFKRVNASFRNINDTLWSNFSLSFVPPISTNRLLSINTTNKFALNLLVGYSKGIKVAEVGGLVNIDNGNVSYAQVGGIGNVVSGNVKGVQIGGIFNVNSLGTNGVQIGGIVNVNKGRINGLQLSGITGISSSQLNGSQVSGIYSKALKVNGLQLSGIVNSADTLNGVQVAGIVNRVKYAKGLQLGLLNFAEAHNGIPIGVLSFVKNGYHKLELQTDEMGFVSLSLGTGVNKLHNLILAGINYNHANYWTYGYGLGTVLPIKNKWSLAMSITAQQMQPMDSYKVELCLLSKYFAGFEYAFGQKWRIGFGPHFNVLTSSVTDPNYQFIPNEIVPYTLSSSFSGSTSVKTWVGGKVYLKLF